MAEITHMLAANISTQFFLVITTPASTRCLVENFQSICYSQWVNATSQYDDSGSPSFLKMAKRSDGCSRITLLASCARKKKLQRKMTKHYWWIVAEEILAWSVSRQMIVIALFTCLCLKNKPGICSINCHIQAMTGNCSASFRVFADWPPVVSAMTGNPPL